MRYDVHLYVTVRVKVCDVEAEDQIGAIEVAERQFYDDPEGFLKSGEYADEVPGALVDEHGDVDYANSRCYTCIPNEGWKVGI